ncbi:extracellular solute-binding protein [Yoonia vestfoldensis]|uniref:Maltose ABC transporter periplasmic protein n=1 Tax=Yoonia vestfoldensis TaxID=245188 RepID=A0A1Y0ECC8_9RHOB|nr:extracellular solute-binding protein [Yoonia vestfoldensis]ARU01148.1 maltose ABC transporter periplasmic protein [Yoonia vestfoldensis]
MRRTLAFPLSAALALTGAAAVAQDLITRDRVGPADAPNVMTFRLTGFDLYSSDPATRAFFETQFLDLMADYPDWRIATQLQTDNIGQEQARMLEQVRAGRGPDCAMIDSSQLGLFKSAGVLSPMNAHFSQDQIADLFPFVRDAVTDADGNLLAWWWFTSLQVLYRDTSLVPDAPATWDDLQAAALTTVAAGREGVLFNGGRWEGTAFDWLPNFWAQGGELVDAEGRPVFNQGDNRAKMLAAITYYKDLVESGAAPSRVVTIINYDEFNAAAAAGTAGLFIGGNWQYGQLRGTLPADQFANWELSELPGPTPDQRATGTGGWTIGAFSDDPTAVEICARIAYEIYATEGNAFQGLLPTSAGIYDAYDAFDGPEYDAFAAALVNGVARPGAAIYPEISNQLQILLGDVLSGAATPEDALDAAAAAVDAAYARQ